MRQRAEEAHGALPKQTYGQVVQEGGPFGRRAQRRDVVGVAARLLVAGEQQARRAVRADSVQVRRRLDRREQLALQMRIHSA